jgi:MFS family permease
VVASIICALLIDKVGRKPWYWIAFLVATVPLLTLSWLGATSAIEVLILATAAYAVLQTIARTDRCRAAPDPSSRISCLARIFAPHRRRFDDDGRDRRPPGIAKGQ